MQTSLGELARCRPSRTAWCGRPGRGRGRLVTVTGTSSGQAAARAGHDHRDWDQAVSLVAGDSRLETQLPLGPGGPVSEATEAGQTDNVTRLGQRHS